MIDLSSTLFAKLIGEIIYTLGNYSCFEWTVVTGAVQSSQLWVITHLGLLADRYKSAVQTHHLSVPLKACSFH